jgi:hypothetical protein
MKNNQFPKYPQGLEDGIDALSDYLFEKHNDAFDVFYLEECANDDIDNHYSACALADGNEVTQIS